MKKYFILIFFFVINLGNTFCSTEFLSVKKSCQDPDDEFLSKLLSNFTIAYIKYEQNRLKDPNKISTLDSESQTIQTKASNFLVDNSDCNLFSRNASIINQASLCPWRFKQIFRKAMFPKEMNQIQCTCDSCMVIGNAKIYRHALSCQPVLKKRHALHRTNECINGIYKWDIIVEHVGVACVCGFGFKLVPFLKI